MREKINITMWSVIPPGWDSAESNYFYEVPLNASLADYITEAIKKGFNPGSEMHNFMIIYKDSMYGILDMSPGYSKYRRIYFRTEADLLLFKLAVQIE